MTGSETTIVLIGLHQPRDATLEARLLGMLEVHSTPECSWRWLGDRLLVAWVAHVRRTRQPPIHRRVERLEADPAVRRVRVLASGQRLWSHGVAADRAPSACGPLDREPGGPPRLIAGPCTVESEEQLLETAALAAEAGAHGLRAGLYKPRTSPYSFPGLGDSGLPYLKRVRDRYRLPVVTEVLEREQLDRVAAHADVLQIGSRNMFNASLLFASGEHRSGLPVLLKRGLGATVEEFLWAAEYVLLGRFAAGQPDPRLLLCERGVRAVASPGRFVFDPAVIPWLRARTFLPIFVDPSHAAGERDLVIPLACAAVGAGADGLLVEVHPHPEKAWCDGRHALDGPGIRSLAEQLCSRPVPRGDGA